MGVITSTPTAVKTGIIYPTRIVKGDTKSSKMGSMTTTPTAERRAAFTLAVVSKAALTSVKWAAQNLHKLPKNGQQLP